MYYVYNINILLFHCYIITTSVLYHLNHYCIICHREDYMHIDAVQSVPCSQELRELYILAKRTIVAQQKLKPWHQV